MTHKARLVLFWNSGKCEFKTHFQCEDLLFRDHTINPLVVQIINNASKEIKISLNGDEYCPADKLPEKLTYQMK